MADPFSLALIAITNYPVAHRAVAPLALFPHPQQRRMACIHKIDDAGLHFAGVLSMKATGVLLKGTVVVNKDVA